MMVDDVSAISGERAAYVPCHEVALAAAASGQDTNAVYGADEGFVTHSSTAVAEPADATDTQAVAGQGRGFVAAPCTTGCIDQTNLGRDLATSWIYSTFLTPNMDTYFNRTSLQRTIFGPLPLDEYNLGVHDNQTFYSYRQNYLPEPYPGSSVCFTSEDGPHTLACPPFTTWEHRVARVVGGESSEHPWHTLISDLTFPPTPSFDHDAQWDWELRAGSWGTGTPVDGVGTVLLTGTTSYNDGRKEMPSRLTGSSSDQYLQYYIRFATTPPGGARIRVAVTDDATHEFILRQCG